LHFLYFYDISATLRFFFVCCKNAVVATIALVTT
jgi:hypothetical protein